MPFHIKIGVIAGVVLTVIHFAFTLGMILSQYDAIETAVVMANFILYGALTYGIYRGKALCAVVLFLYYLSGREWSLWLQGESLISIILPAIFGIMLLLSIYGSYWGNSRGQT